MSKLNASQQKIYEYLCDCMEDGFSPSTREICRAVGLKSTSTVHLYLDVLEREGLITRERGQNRSIRVVGAETGATWVPLVGRVTAGVPIESPENLEGYIPVSLGRYRRQELFALKVVGDSMIDAGIFDGDILVVYKTREARNGEIVVAMVEGAITVKRFYWENGHVRLQPENLTMEPIIVDEATLLGRVVASIRYY